MSGALLPGSRDTALLGIIGNALRCGTRTQPATIDERTRKFWTDYDRETYYHRSIPAVNNRLRIFYRNPLNTILSTPALSFKNDMNTAQRIIFLNVSELVDQQQECTGQLLLAQIQQAILSRNKIPERRRIPYYLYIDEFQMFAEHSGDSLRHLFNGARKFKLAVTIAHQTTADLPTRLLRVIADNAGTKICRLLEADDAAFFAKMLQIRRPDSTAYAPEVLQNLTKAEAYVSTPSRRISVRVTIPRYPLVRRSSRVPKSELIALSKRNYGLTPVTEPETEDLEIEQEYVEEPPYTPPAPEPPQRREPPKKTPSQPPRSKTPHQTPVSDSPTLDPKTQPEEEAELFDTPQHLHPKHRANRQRRHHPDQPNGKNAIGLMRMLETQISKCTNKKVPPLRMVRLFDSTIFQRKNRTTLPAKQYLETLLRSPL